MKTDIKDRIKDYIFGFRCFSSHTQHPKTSQIRYFPPTKSLITEFIIPFENYFADTINESSLCDYLRPKMRGSKKN